MAKKFVEVYEEIAKIPELKNGRILHIENKNESSEDPNISLQILWKSRNLADQKFHTLANNVLVNGKSVIRFPSVPLDTDVVLHSISRSGMKTAKITQNTNEENLIICDSEGRGTFINLKNNKSFGKVYCDPYISCLEWSSDETKIAFVAEEARGSGTTFYSKPIGKNEERGEKHLYLEDWGEQMKDQHQGVVVIIDIESEDASVILLPKGITPGQLTWRPHYHTIVGVGYPSNPYRIGIAYCSDRESFLFAADIQGMYEELTPRRQHVKSPRFSSSGNKLIFLQSTMYGERAPASQIAFIEWTTKKTQILLDYVNMSRNILGNKSFPGVCGKTILPKRCFDSQERKIWFSAYKISNYVTYTLDLESKEITEVTNPNDYMVILDIYKDWALFLKSSFTETDRIYLSKVDSELVKYVICTPVTIEHSLKHIKKDWCTVLRFKSHVKDKKGQDLMLSALFIGPTTLTADNEKKRPLICCPHGGPHSVIGNRFNHVFAFFVSIGYSVVLPNYRGSIGHGNDFLTASLGQCGEADVQDCFQSVEEVLARYENAINKKQIYLFGFSHGGFLTMHLTTKYPNTFKAQATLNPASDIYIMGAVSDIPEWAFLEYGLPFTLGRGFDLKAVTKMFEISPVHHIDKMKTPTLILLGNKDVRVPPSQGLGYYKMLLARNVPTRVYMYDDDHPLGKLSSESDYVIQVAKWFEEHST